MLIEESHIRLGLDTHLFDLGPTKTTRGENVVKCIISFIFPLLDDMNSIYLV